MNSRATLLKQWTIFFFLSVAWGSSYFWIKIALREIPSDQIVALRVTLASMGLATIAYLAQKPLPRDLGTIVQLGVLSLFSITMPFLLLSWGVSQISSSLTGILNGTVPLFTVLFAHFALPDERLTPTKLLGLALGFAGAMLLVRSGQNTAHTLTAMPTPHAPLLGALAVLTASACYATGAVFARKHLEHVPSATKAASVTLIAAVLVWALQIGLAINGTRPLRMPSAPTTWLALCWLGLIGSCLAYVAYFYLLSEWDATRVSFVMYVAPLVAVIMGVVLLGEEADSNLFAGAGLVVSGVTVTNVRKKKRQRHGS